MVLLISFFCLSGFASNKVVNWGVVPNSLEKTPEPPVGGAELLQKYNGIFVANTDKKEIFFTFDLGYEAGYTSEVLDIMAKHNIKATFFLCGHYLNEDVLVRRMIADGHVIGNHTNKHKDLPTLSEAAIRADVTEFTTMFDEKYGTEYGKPLTQFRHPKGRISERDMKIVNELGLKTILWSGAIVDWGKTPIDAQSNADKLTKRAHPGGIYLLHISNSGMPKMLDLLIPQLVEKGYTIGNAWEL